MKGKKKAKLEIIDIRRYKKKKYPCDKNIEDVDVSFSYP